MWYARYDDGSVTGEFLTRKELIDHLDEYCDGFGQVDLFTGDPLGKHEYQGTINL